MGQKGPGLGHMTYFWILEPSYNLWMGWSYKPQISQPNWW